MTYREALREARFTRAEQGGVMIVVLDPSTEEYDWGYEDFISDWTDYGWIAITRVEWQREVSL